MLLTAGAGALAGGAINKYRHYRTHQQAMIIEDYVRLHPDLFPENSEYFVLIIVISLLHINSKCLWKCI